MPCESQNPGSEVLHSIERNYPEVSGTKHAGIVGKAYKAIFWVGGFSLTLALHIACRGVSYLHFRYPKCLVIHE